MTDSRSFARRAASLANRTGAAAIGVALALAAWVVPAQAQSPATWPDKPIRFIAPSPPGGGTDTLSRLVAQKVGERTGWTIAVENKPGAGGNLGMDLVAKAAPDGTTLALGESSNLLINPALYKTMPFDPAKDLAPVALVGTVPLVLVVSVDRPWESLAALTAAAKTQKLSFASSGSGTVGHLTGEIWKRAAGVDVLHVPYKGAGPVMTDLIGGRVDMHFASLPAALPLIRGGKLRALAVTTPKRLPTLPAVPTFVEAGLPDFDYHVTYGVVAPAGTPPAIVARLNAEIRRALETPDAQRTLADLNVDHAPTTPEQFAAFLAKERAQWAGAVKASGATVD